MALGFHSSALPFYRDITASLFVDFLVIYKLMVYQDSFMYCKNPSWYRVRVNSKEMLCEEVRLLYLLTFLWYYIQLGFVVMVLSNDPFWRCCYLFRQMSGSRFLFPFWECEKRRVLLTCFHNTSLERWASNCNLFLGGAKQYELCSVFFCFQCWFSFLF